MHRLAILISLIAAPAKMLAAPPVLISGSCDHLRGQDLYDCEISFEAELFKTQNKYFERKGDTLILKAKADGRSITLLDKPPKSWKDHGGLHRVVAFYPAQQISHIRITGYEYYRSFVFHHASGDKEDVLWRIAISPDAKLLVGYSAELDINWKKNGLTIYSIKNWGLEPLASYHPTAFGIEGVKFIGPKEIELNTVCYSENLKAQGYYGEGRAHIKLADSVWQIGQISCGEKY